jgi:hypothetical protein
MDSAGLWVCPCQTLDPDHEMSWSCFLCELVALSVSDDVLMISPAMPSFVHALNHEATTNIIIIVSFMKKKGWNFQYM